MYDSIHGTSAARKAHDGEEPGISLSDAGQLLMGYLRRADIDTREAFAAFEAWDTAHKRASQIRGRDYATSAEHRQAQGSALKELELLARVLRFAVEEIWLAQDSEGDL